MVKTDREISPEMLLSFANMFPKKDQKVARGKVKPGIYPVSVTVVMQGQLVVSPPVMYTPSAELPVTLVLACALRKAGIQKENIKTLLLEAAADEAWSDDPDAVAAAHDLEAAIEEATETLRKLPKKERNGSVQAHVTLSFVDLLTGK